MFWLKVLDLDLLDTLVDDVFKFYNSPTRLFVKRADDWSREEVNGDKVFSYFWLLEF